MSDTSNAGAAVSATLKSFVYEKLLVQVIMMQQQIIKTVQFLDECQKNDKKVQDQLKSRSLTFIDPYGNAISNKYMDHEIISTIFKKYKKSYVPRCLNQWIKFGIMNGNMILPINECDMKSPLAKYTNDDQFVIYGEVVVWIGNYEYLSPQKFVLRVRADDNMEKIKMYIKERQSFTSIELKSCIINEKRQANENDWNDGTILKSEDNIMSSRLYQDNCVVMAKIIEEENDMSTDSSGFQIFIKTLVGRSSNLVGKSEMHIGTMKEILQATAGIPVDLQCLIYNGKQLEDDRTLSYYNIQKEATINLVLNLRGGMYHFSSGRQDFENLPNTSAEAIKKILTFNINDMNRMNDLSPVELQDLVLEAQIILTDLLHETKDFFSKDDVPNLKNVVLRITDNNEDCETNSNDQ